MLFSVSKVGTAYALPYHFLLLTQAAAQLNTCRRKQKRVYQLIPCTVRCAGLTLSSNYVVVFYEGTNISEAPDGQPEEASKCRLLEGVKLTGIFTIRKSVFYFGLIL